MKITFAIPAYNEEKNIAKCLESVIKEIDRNNVEAEIIVIDNNSIDNTSVIANSFKSVKTVLEEKKGLPFARQRGYLESTGELIANIDSDTIMPNGWLKTVISEFTKNEKLVGLSGPYRYYDLKPWCNFVTKLFYFAGYGTYIFNRFIIRRGSMMQGGNFIIKKTALDKIGGFNTKLKFWGEDTDIAMRLSKVGPVKFTFKLKMLTTGRRLMEEGVVKAGLRYIINYLYVIIKGSPKDNEYKDHRN